MDASILITALGIASLLPDFYHEDAEYHTGLDSIALPPPYTPGAAEVEAAFAVASPDVFRFQSYCNEPVVFSGPVGTKCLGCMREEKAQSLETAIRCEAGEGFAPVTPGACVRRATYGHGYTGQKCRTKIVTLDVHTYENFNVVQAPCPDIEVGIWWWSETYPASNPCCIARRVGDSEPTQVVSCEEYH